jgi:phage-related protein
MQAQGLRGIDFLQTNGPQQVREPYVKSVEEKLWEICLRGRSSIARALYFAKCVSLARAGLIAP